MNYGNKVILRTVKNTVIMRFETRLETKKENSFD